MMSKYANIIVQKFGGSSVATPELVLNAARKVAETRKTGANVVVVVSAMGKTTDGLLNMVRQLSERPDPREVDMLLATGEQISIAMMAIALQELGFPAVSFTGPQVGILTDTHHGRARIKKININRIQDAFKEGKIVVVAGFQGATVDNEITTLGRGGSDTTAVALAAALKAKRCDIYTDVEGVFTTDPRIVPEARLLPRITYDEMLELASMGAKVLHSRSVEIAKNFDVPLVVLSTFKDGPGTLVTQEVPQMEDIVVSGVAYNRNEAKISLLDVPDRPGIASEIFQSLAEANIIVDMIVQSVGHDNLNTISFTVTKEDYHKALDVARQLQKRINARDIASDTEIAKVSVVGVGMRTHCGVAAKMFKALAEANINIDMITTSEIKISVVVDAKDMEKAVKVIHDAFELANPVKAE